MIVVDSSVWIDALRGNPTPQVRRLTAGIKAGDDIIIGDLILCEVLQGVASERQARRVERDMRRFDVVAIVDAGLAVDAAANYRRLRHKGVTIRKTIDLLIGTFCIRHRHELLHSDRDYDAMEQHLGLRVLRP